MGKGGRRMTSTPVWKIDKAWTDRLLPEVARHCAPFLIQPATEEEDKHEATDLRVLVARDVRIGVRLRRYQYASGYGHEITIRASRRSGVTTEFAKIMQGWGDYFFYGFADPTESTLVQWSLYDLKEVRRILWTETQRYGASAIRPYLRGNRDGGSKFYALPAALLSSARCDGTDHSTTSNFVRQEVA
jgi:hypothetical protein